MASKFRPAEWGGGGKRSVLAHGSTRDDTPEPATSGPDATDAAKALAAQHGINLNDVTATGATGITKGDVETYIEANTEPEPEVEVEPEPEIEEPEVDPQLPLEKIPDEADLPVAETA